MNIRDESREAPPLRRRMARPPGGVCHCLTNPSNARSRAAEREGTCVNRR